MMRIRICSLNFMIASSTVSLLFCSSNRRSGSFVSINQAKGTMNDNVEEIKNLGRHLGACPNCATGIHRIAETLRLWPAGGLGASIHRNCDWNESNRSYGFFLPPQCFLAFSHISGSGGAPGASAATLHRRQRQPSSPSLRPAAAAPPSSCPRRRHRPPGVRPRPAGGAPAPPRPPPAEPPPPPGRRRPRPPPLL